MPAKSSYPLPPTLRQGSEAAHVDSDAGSTAALTASPDIEDLPDAAAAVDRAGAVDPGFDIVVDYTGDATYEAVFTEAAARWEEIILGDLPDFASAQYGLIDDLLIDASVVAIDGTGGILGQAGPDSFRTTTLLPAHGIMEFDSADVEGMLAAGTLDDVILHEIGHVLGIGILWDFLGTRNTLGDYVGAHGLAEYRALSGNPAAASVPVEHDGGSGTAEAHWDEETFDAELMTGYAEGSGAMPISRITVGLLEDMGYVVDYAAADPYTLYYRPSTDFDGDGKSDLLVQRTDGQIAVWLVSGTALTGGAHVGPPLGASWKAIDSGEFNGDGKSDILMQSTDGQVVIWMVDGTNLISGVYVGTNPGPSWKAIGSGDFNDDSKSDILFQSTNGLVSIWELDGTDVIGGAGTLVGSNPSTSWKAKGSGDFDGDGNSDILFQHTNGAISIWQLDGTDVIGGLGTYVGSNPGPSWQVRGTGDFNADGNSDILFQHTNGSLSIWEMAGSTVIGGIGTYVGSNPGSLWQTRSTGDYNGDGNADIAFQHTSGAVSIWEMDGTDVIGGLGTIVTASDASWTVV
jgi:hypothetical protein